MKDLIAARLEAELPILFEVGDTRVLDLESAEPRVCFTHAGEPIELRCKLIAGCDGFHGVCRPAIPAQALRVYERDYPFAWLGILARAKPASEELIYACHEQGFALLSMRSPDVTRLYLQVAPDEPLENWPDERIWHELQVRLSTSDGFVLNQGPVLEGARSKTETQPSFASNCTSCSISLGVSRAVMRRSCARTC